jgi:hypothetical protein
LEGSIPSPLRTDAGYLRRYGLGSRRRVGVNGSTGVRWFAGFGGKEVTTSGSSRVFSA